jgi:tetratricopeptide (TPR) repeat protein
MNEEMIEFDIEFLSQKLAEEPRSPLFARLADLYLQKDQTVEALSLCKDGVALFPEYYAGYIVLGRTFLALKEYSNARSALERARLLSPFNQTMAALLHSIPGTPDEPVRTTDANYFAPQKTPSAEPIVHSDQPAETPQQMMSEEELIYSQPAERPVSQTDQHQFIGERIGSAQQYPSFDEYLQQNKDRVSVPATMTLDDYLSLSGSPEPVTAAVEPATGIDMTEQHGIAEEPHTFVVEEIGEPEARMPEPFIEEQMPVSEETVFEQPQEEQTIVVEQELTESPPEYIEQVPQTEQIAENEQPQEEQTIVIEQELTESLPEYIEQVQQTEQIAENEQTESLEEETPGTGTTVQQNAEEPEIVFTSPEQAQLFAEEHTPAAGTDIDDLTQRLQNVERIVPEEQYGSPSPAQEETEEAFDSNMVTPTLAEIYASQGEYTAAIQAYEILMFTQPGKTAQYQQRVKELQKLKMEKDGTI